MILIRFCFSIGKILPWYWHFCWLSISTLHLSWLIIVRGSRCDGKTVRRQVDKYYYHLPNWRPTCRICYYSASHYTILQGTCSFCRILWLWWWYLYHDNEFTSYVHRGWEAQSGRDGTGKLFAVIRTCGWGSNGRWCNTSLSLIFTRLNFRDLKNSRN